MTTDPIYITHDEGQTVQEVKKSYKPVCVYQNTPRDNNIINNVLKLDYKPSGGGVNVSNLTVKEKILTWCDLHIPKFMIARMWMKGNLL